MQSYDYGNMVIVFSSCLASQLCAFQSVLWSCASDSVLRNNFLMFLKLAKSFCCCCGITKGRSSSIYLLLCRSHFCEEAFVVAFHVTGACTKCSKQQTLLSP